LVTLNSMLGADRDHIRPLARQLWSAPPQTRRGHPLERCASLGAALMLILERDDVRARLDYVELDPAVPEVSLVWDHGSRVTFGPFATPRLYRRRVANVADKLGYGRRQLPASSLDEIAAMMEPDEGAEENDNGTSSTP
jgi:hypothetical protein